MTDLIAHLASFGERPAVVTASEELTYTELAERVAVAAEAFGRTRRLVLIRTRNELGTLVPYLGALAGRHVPLPVPPDRDAATIIDTYRPDAVVERDGRVTTVAAPSAPRLHDDLALLLSTSGSTGSPKLVRLSRDNLASNAESIAEYLQISENDCAPTTLPMSYCYGLSVVHSYLLRGACLLLTDRSVIDDEFWTLFRRHGATSLAGVPYTFDLLDSIGFQDMDLPTLRYVTQAGGRLPPERVRRYAHLGQARGWDFVVMYGATEATARMAYLPAALAPTHPASIGHAIPGGSFDIEPTPGWPEPGVGELVYRGPNVMLGYAQGPGDLALGRTVTALRTGDIATRGTDGLIEIIGRRSRFVKLFGLRVDLQRVETTLAQQGIASLCTDDGDDLLVAVEDRHDPVQVRTAAATAAGVPADAVTVVALAELPSLPSGKPDYAAVRNAAPADAVTADTDLRQLFADVLHVDPGQIRSHNTFLQLGGTSLNYVTMSVRLQRMLGRLPRDWQQMSVRELCRCADEKAAAGRPPVASMDTGVLLRALAIVLVVGSHAELFELWGGAHVLLGVAGYNFGRFCLAPVPRSERIRYLRNTIGWIAVPSIAWIAAMLVLTDDYHASNLLLANKILGPADSMTAGRLWFIEVLVYVLVVLTAACAIPLVDRAERRAPYAFAAAFLVFGVALRFDVFGFDLGREAWFTYLAFWFFAVGWAAVKARTNWQRLALTVVVTVCIYGYFGDALREIMVLTGLLLLIWLPTVRWPAPLAVPVGVLAEASLYTYLTHFQVYPLFGEHRLLGVIASLAVGVLVTLSINYGRRAWSRTSRVPRPFTDATRRAGRRASR
jgi:acyl-CoA synthetase (AMP-forming)/AMP-acid ligase II